MPQNPSRISFDQAPRSVADVLDENATFEPAALAAGRALARSKPWRGTVEERLAKFNACIAALCTAYAMEPIAVVREGEAQGAIAGTLDIRARKIIYDPGNDWLSVVTLLHLFSAARGLNVFGRFRWSVNLFRRCFPISYGRCVHVGPYLLKPDRAQVVRAAMNQV